MVTVTRMVKCSTNKDCASRLLKTKEEISDMMGSTDMKGPQSFSPLAVRGKMNSSAHEFDNVRVIQPLHCRHGQRLAREFQEGTSPSLRPGMPVVLAALWAGCNHLRFLFTQSGIRLQRDTRMILWTSCIHQCLQDSCGRPSHS